MILAGDARAYVERGVALSACRQIAGQACQFLRLARDDRLLNLDKRVRGFRR
jgi:hypothetical protein